MLLHCCRAVEEAGGFVLGGGLAVGLLKNSPQHATLCQHRSALVHCIRIHVELVCCRIDSTYYLEHLTLEDSLKATDKAGMQEIRHCSELEISFRL